MPPGYSNLRVQNSVKNHINLSSSPKKSEYLSSNDFINHVTPSIQSNQAFSKEVHQEKHIWQSREVSESLNLEVNSEISL